jgi:hypothetical protein
MDTFWMVWSPQGRPPTFQHFKLSSAEDEAARLFRENPNSDFYILRATSRARFAVEEKPVVHEQLDDIPF